MKAGQRERMSAPEALNTRRQRLPVTSLTATGSPNHFCVAFIVAKPVG